MRRNLLTNKAFIITMFDKLIGQTLDGKYRIEERIAGGAAANLYRATHISMDKQVAVKVLHAHQSGFSERLENEARVVSRISHPHILNVTDSGTDSQGFPFIVFEYHEAQTLAQYLKQNGRLSLAKALSITRQIAGALTAAHANGVLHLDISPENILVMQTPDGTEWIKVFNFSISSDVSADSDDDLRQSHFYHAPEQFSEENVSEKTDIYSLAALFYQMLAGNPLFIGKTRKELAAAHAESPIPSILSERADIPRPIDYVLLRALSKAPEQRFQNVADFNDALERAANNSEEITVAAPNALPAAAAAVTPAAANSDNNLWKTAFIVLAGVTLMSAGFFFFTQQNTQRVDLNTVPANSDPNAQPVQPLNPATGVVEQLPAQMPYGNSNMAYPMPGVDPSLQTLPSASGAPSTMPPNGYPSDSRVMIPPPNGPTYTIPGSSNSPFMPDDYIIVNGNVAVPANTKPSPTPKGNANANANVAVPTVSPSPKASPSPSPKASPNATPNAAPSPTASPNDKPKTPTPSEKPKPKETPTEKSSNQ